MSKSKIEPANTEGGSGDQQNSKASEAGDQDKYGM